MKTNRLIVDSEGVWLLKGNKVYNYLDEVEPLVIVETIKDPNLIYDWIGNCEGSTDGVYPGNRNIAILVKAPQKYHDQGRRHNEDKANDVCITEGIIADAIVRAKYYMNHINDVDNIYDYKSCGVPNYWDRIEDPNTHTVMHWTNQELSEFIENESQTGLIKTEDKKVLDNPRTYLFGFVKNSDRLIIDFGRQRAVILLDQ